MVAQVMLLPMYVLFVKLDTRTHILIATRTYGHKEIQKTDLM